VGINLLEMLDLVPILTNMPAQIVFANDVVKLVENAGNCDRCGECEKKCPYGISVMALLVEYSNLYWSRKKEYEENRVSRQS
jgi:ferredoxin